MDDWLERNRQWALQKKGEEAEFFPRLSKGQSPALFWIGCCDSRVIPTELFNLSLGDVFVQTNIANQVRADDHAMMGALHYAVDVLKVEQIAVCGHTHCGGVHAALNPDVSVPASVSDWVAPLAERYSERVARGEVSAESVAELNVQDQVGHINVLLGHRPQPPSITGLFFRVEEGRVSRLLPQPSQ